MVSGRMVVGMKEERRKNGVRLFFEYLRFGRDLHHPTSAESAVRYSSVNVNDQSTIVSALNKVTRSHAIST